MRTPGSTLLLPLFLTACAQSAGYGNTYEVGGSGPVHASDAERTFITQASELKGGAQFRDKPLRFLHAPQPTMPPEAIRGGVTGDVVVDLFFDEQGHVERVTVRSSTSELLSNAVVSATSQWQIEPVTMSGKPTKFVARQKFQFRLP